MNYFLEMYVFKYWQTSCVKYSLSITKWQTRCLKYYLEKLSNTYWQNQLDGYAMSGLFVWFEGRPSMFGLRISMALWVWTAFHCIVSTGMDCIRIFYVGLKEEWYGNALHCL